MLSKCVNELYTPTKRLADRLGAGMAVKQGTVVALVARRIGGEWLAGCVAGVNFMRGAAIALECNGRRSSIVEIKMPKYQAINITQ
jgi:hypothetical protein